MIDHIKLSGTTNSSGAATITAPIPIRGAKLMAVEWIDGDLADGIGATLSVTGTSSGVDHTILTLANPLANADKWYYPRVAAHDNAGAGVTYDGTNEIYVCDIIAGTLKLVIASGGSTKTGGCVVHFET